MQSGIIATLLLFTSLILAGCLSPRPFDEKAWRKQIDEAKVSDLYAPHRNKDGNFFNPWFNVDKSFWDLMAWRFSQNPMSGLEDETPPAEVVPNKGEYLGDSAARPSLTWIGHASFALNWGGQVVLTDPVFSDSLLYVVGRLTPPAFGAQAVPEGAVVLISHNHYDHLDEDSIEALAKKDAVFICPLGLGELLKGMGASVVYELDWWQEKTINRTRITCLPAQHWSRRIGMDRNESLWCSFMLERDQIKVFYGADSGYYHGFKEIGRRFPGIKAALIGVGAFAPRWFMHTSHLNIPEALKARQDLKAQYLVPTQWGVFELGDEPAAWPAEELRRAMIKDPALKQHIRILPVGGKLYLD